MKNKTKNYLSFWSNFNTKLYEEIIKAKQTKTK